MMGRVFVWREMTLAKLGKYASVGVEMCGALFTFYDEFFEFSPFFLLKELDFEQALTEALSFRFILCHFVIFIIRF
jgi:hypothetical protein